MKYPFENLVFEGGGVKGIAYVGALEVLEEEGILDNVKNVAGSSAGAIAAALVGLGYKNARLKTILTEIDFMDFFDLGSLSEQPNVFQRLFSQYGLAKGDAFSSWLEDLFWKIGFKKDLTFKMLDDIITYNDYDHLDRHCRRIYLTGTNLNTGVSEIYSHETTPDMRIIDAVRISMSCPLAFVAKPNDDGDLCVDGGVLCNYPIRVFDYDLTLEPYERYIETSTNKSTLGIRLSPGDLYYEPEIKKQPINNLFDYAVAIVNSYLSFQDNVHLEGDDWARTAHVDSLGIETLQFNITTEQKEALIASGRKGMQTYLDWFRNA